MKLSPQSIKEIEEIMGKIECPFDFQCYKSGFEELCGSPMVDSGKLVGCLTKTLRRVIFRFRSVRTSCVPARFGCMSRSTTASRCVQFAQLGQVEGFGVAEFHSAIHHFAVRGVGEDFPLAAAGAPVAFGLFSGDALVGLGRVGFVQRADQDIHKPAHTPAAPVVFDGTHDEGVRIRNPGRWLLRRCGRLRAVMRLDRLGVFVHLFQIGHRVTFARLMLSYRLGECVDLKIPQSPVPVAGLDPFEMMCLPSRLNFLVEPITKYVFR